MPLTRSPRRSEEPINLTKCAITFLCLCLFLSFSFLSAPGVSDKQNQRPELCSRELRFFSPHFAFFLLFLSLLSSNGCDQAAHHARAHARSRSRSQTSASRHGSRGLAPGLFHRSTSVALRVSRAARTGKDGNARLISGATRRRRMIPLLFAADRCPPGFPSRRSNKNNPARFAGIISRE